MNKSNQISYMLDRIFESEGFVDSKTSQRLLKYLVDASLKGEELKEYNIAIDVFNKNPNYDPTGDASIRVNIHNLRRKLDSYYNHEGKTDPIKISIPKGHYRVEFNEEKQENKKTSYLLHILSITVIIILTILLILKPTANNNYKTINSNDPVWGSLLNDRNSNQFILGNYYFFRMLLDSTSNAYTRIVTINSDQDFADYIKTHPQYKDITTPKNKHSYLTKDVPYGLSLIMSILPIQNRQFDLKLASEVSLDDLNKSNSIFIGSFKNLNTLKPLLKSLQIDYITNGAILKVGRPNSDVITTYNSVGEPETGYSIDNCIVAKIPAPNNNILYLFLSTHDIGNVSTIQKFTDLEFLQKFKTKFKSSKHTPFFLAVYEVKGKERTGLSMKELYFREIEPDFDLFQGLF